MTLPLQSTWMMKRKGVRFSSMLFGIALTLLMSLPLLAAEKTVGVIITGSNPYYTAVHQALQEELNRQGFGPGKLKFSIQKPEPELLAWMNAARKLAANDVSLIITYGSGPSMAVIKEIHDIPGVFAAVSNPEDLSGKNITGVGFASPVPALIRDLKIISKCSRVAVLYNSTEMESLKQVREAEQLESQVGFKLLKCDFNKVSPGFKIPSADAILITSSSKVMHYIDFILFEARRLHIPTASALSGGEQKGVIITNCADAESQGTEAANLVEEIARGKKVSALKVKRAGKMQIIINQREAKSIGINLPFDLVAMATKVIK